jgi:hypothetical protein
MIRTGEDSKAGWLDRAAITLSGLCLIHCLGTALLVAMTATAASAFLNPLIHEIGLALAIGLGVLALGSGLFSHGRKMPLLIGALGLCAMAYALSLKHGVAGEVVFTILGVCLVAIGHSLNWRAQTGRA